MADEHPVATQAAQVEDPYEFRLSGPGLTITRHVSEATALQLIAVAMGSVGLSTMATGHPGRLSPATPSGRAEATVPTSLREFMDDVNARKIPEKILAITQFLISSGQKQVVTREEIRNSFRHAGEPVPANLPRDFTNTLSLAWIAADPLNPDGYFVTRKGATALESKFSEVTTTPPASRRRRSPAAASNGAAAEPATGDQEENTHE